MSCDTWYMLWTFLFSLWMFQWWQTPIFHSSFTVHHGNPIVQSRVVEVMFLMQHNQEQTISLGVFSQVLLTFLKPGQTWVRILPSPPSFVHSPNRHLWSIFREPEDLQNRPRLRFHRASILVGPAAIHKSIHKQDHFTLWEIRGLRPTWW